MRWAAQSTRLINYFFCSTSSHYEWFLVFSAYWIMQLNQIYSSLMEYQTVKHYQKLFHYLRMRITKACLFTRCALSTLNAIWHWWISWHFSNLDGKRECTWAFGNLAYICIIYQPLACFAKSYQTALHIKYKISYNFIENDCEFSICMCSFYGHWTCPWSIEHPWNQCVVVVDATSAFVIILQTIFTTSFN